VRETRERGGIPVLMNCVVRRNFAKVTPKNDDDEALRGTTFKDETGHGYDMDWTKSVKEFTDGGGYQNNGSAASHIKWVKDEINVCSE
jgi:hypothetical protein